MLREAVQHVIEIVALPGNAVAETIVRKSRHGFDQRIVSAFGIGDGLAPGGLRGFGNAREILRRFKLSFRSTQTAVNRAIPRGNVQNQLPDAVNVAQWFSRGRGRVHVLQKLEQSGSVPRAAVKGAAELVGDAGGFGRPSRPRYTLDSALPD